MTPFLLQIAWTLGVEQRFPRLQLYRYFKIREEYILSVLDLPTTRVMTVVLGLSWFSLTRI